MKKNRLLAIILARGGSKEVPRKNLRLLNDKPLIAYSIEEALKSKCIDRLILSTDDEEIAEIAQKFGVEVPFLRPKELATDDAKSQDAMIHAINWLKDNENYESDYVMLIQPTSPLRIAEDIDKAFKKLIREAGDSLIGLSKVEKHPYLMMKIENNIVNPFNENRLKYTRRQDLPEIYQINGAIYITKTELFLKEKQFWAGKTIPYVMPKERSIDVDDILDLKFAEMLLKERKKSKNK